MMMAILHADGYRLKCRICRRACAQKGAGVCWARSTGMSVRRKRPGPAPDRNGHKMNPVTPGRPPSGARRKGDKKRIMTQGRAIIGRRRLLVVGRPITGKRAADPKASADAVRPRSQGASGLKLFRANVDTVRVKKTRSTIAAERKDGMAKKGYWIARCRLQNMDGYKNTSRRTGAGVPQIRAKFMGAAANVRSKGGYPRDRATSCWSSRIMNGAGLLQFPRNRSS